MIHSVYGNGAWLNVTTYQGNRPYINTTQPIAGMVRYGNSGNMEVYDGSIWQLIGNGSANIDLNDHVKEILEWAKKKMTEEKKLKALMELHPGLRDLNNQLEMMKILCYKEEESK